MIIYHGTNEKNLISIKSTGMQKTRGRFGEGCYFYTTKKDAEEWSDGSIYSVDIDESKLLHINYDEFFSKHHPELNIEEEEGFTNMETYHVGKSFDGVAVTYRDGVTEVCVYRGEFISKEKTYYHVTLKENWEKIKSEGLVPMIGERSKECNEESKVVWLFPTIADMETALANWLGEWYDDEYGEDVELCSLIITVPVDFEILYNGIEYEIASLNIIEPKYISYRQDE